MLSLYFGISVGRVLLRLRFEIVEHLLTIRRYLRPDRRAIGTIPAPMYCKLATLSGA